MQNQVPEKEINQWNLRGFLIQLSNDKYHWAKFRDLEGHEVFTGDAVVIRETIVMSSWKVRDGNDKVEDPAKMLATLPHWDRTKYYIKIVDFGNSGLCDCKTGDEIQDEKILDTIIPTLKDMGITRSTGVLVRKIN
jgi:hypothetical protein